MFGNHALTRMTHDEDIVAEAEALAGVSVPTGSVNTVASASAETPKRNASHAPNPPPPLVSHPLNWRPNDGGHKPNDATRSVLNEVGGVAGILKFTTLFYENVFADPHLDTFIRDRTENHAERFAFWIAEKLGDAAYPWTADRSKRSVCPFASHGLQFQTPHDRSSAHFAAWHSPKRLPGDFGVHFKLADCRVWMRVHFWSLRASGIAETSPSFTEYYVKFIAHFVSVYEQMAPQFARESFRWSADEENVRKYLANGRVMENVLGVSDRDTLRQLPVDENARGTDWPYC